MNDYQNILEYFNQLPVLVKLVWYVSFLLFIFILGLIFYLKILRNNLRENEKKRIKYQKIYEENLINYLYAGDGIEGISPEQRVFINNMKKDISNTFNRNVLISVMTKLVNDISGEIAQAIHKFYFETGLIDYSLLKLKARKWEIKAAGIHELTQFEVKQAYNEIEKLIKHPHKEVRNQAQLYLVNLFQFKGLKFLNDLTYQLSEWDQIQLLEILQKFDNQEITDITLWLKSNNLSVVKFALKLAKVYNQFESKETLLELLKHNNKEIRVETIKVLGYFYDTDSKEYLKSNFHDITEGEQIAFFKLLENIADQTDQHFIIVNISHPNFEIKLMALKILKNINQPKFNTLKLAENDIDVERIVEFIKNN
ncbi:MULTISPECIES: HEAT repeat domain-containing protein [Flavobacteriaceae]|uniref:HEAT repeat domain-containing protein n=2 Tax=Flavobacteriaceae TaxID=49546 RepID=A0A4Y8AXQ0_9FLAO|nr:MULTISPECIES: HEAT repeat domain-containing protein [Flavobacteriaceae]TEW76748.1 hypothetical protein E2488_02555 [Gramella jeungdoensis]GGK50386.1 hypothetical protein GCM10007963_18400 [Lutibacter litoralis]